jgi:mycothiol synthase
VTVRAFELPRAHLEEARQLLAAACPWDPAAEVAAEKLFGPAPPPHRQATLGAFDGERLIGVAVVSGRWLRLLAVHPEARRRGVGSLLLDEARSRARGFGATRLRTCDQPGNYLAPGVDVRNQEAIAWCERRGFQRVAEYENLRVPLLDNPLVTPAHAAEMATAATERGYQIRRARRGPGRDGGDGAALVGLAKEQFAGAWAFEIERALEHDQPGVHAAFRDNRPVAFACHDGNNHGLGWFGPAGTHPEHRGKGLGQALLLPCLLDVAAAGKSHGVIAWIGPRAFYEGVAGAESDRRFVVLEQTLS